MLEVVWPCSLADAYALFNLRLKTKKSFLDYFVFAGVL